MSNSTLYAFILSFLAGISTLIGACIIFINKNTSNKIITKSLSFAAGVMICVSITDLLPNCYKMILDTNTSFPKVILTLIFMVIGIIISMLIDKYLPTNYNNKTNNKNLYRVGIISMIAIIMHNIPEGIATFITSSNNLKLGITLTIAIALHNIPEGVSIAIPIYHSTNNRKKAIGYSLISGMSEVGGSILAYFFLAPFINDHIMASLYAIIGGIMIHISVYELIPSAYKNNDKKSFKTIITYLIMGILIMIISHIILT